MIQRLAKRGNLSRGAIPFRWSTLASTAATERQPPMRTRFGSWSVIAVLALMVTSLIVGCARLAELSGPAQDGGAKQRVLTRTVEVDGRQGVAAEGGCYWVSGSTTLSKYDKDWNLIAVNENPFAQGYELEVNHIGDIDVYHNEVYCGVELFVDGVASNIQIAVYDGDTLELKRSFNFDPGSGQDECSGICVNPDTQVVSMCAWTDTGDHIYNYDLATGAYLGKVRLSPAPTWIQGVAYHEGAYYLTADDGDANDDAPDHVYRFELADGADETAVELERAIDDVRRQGEIEGLSFDEDLGEMLVLYNRGAVIEQGMPVGFYDGYDHEIHEVYAYGLGA